MQLGILLNISMWLFRTAVIVIPGLIILYKISEKSEVRRLQLENAELKEKLNEKKKGRKDRNDKNR